MCPVGGEFITVVWDLLAQESHWGESQIFTYPVFFFFPFMAMASISSQAKEQIQVTAMKTPNP